MTAINFATKYELQISSHDVNGPLNLPETIQSAQTSEPEWGKTGSSFTDVEEINGIPVKYTLTQAGGVDDFNLYIHAAAYLEINQDFVGAFKEHLRRVLGLEDDIERFYDAYSKDERLSSTFAPLRGLRLMRGTNLYESLICSILSQNNSARLWNRTARLMMKSYGRRIILPDGTENYLFPSPQALAKLRPRELQSRTSMGYRARPVVQISRMVVQDELKLAEFQRCSYDEAMETLLSLPGVGPKVADCFLLYGVGRLEAAPVDVWIHRIVKKLYFRGRNVSRLKTARFLRDRFGLWAGYAQLYLFDYARKNASGRFSR